MHEYLDVLEATKEQQGSVRLQADWATRGWTSFVAGLLADLNDRNCLQRLQLLTEADTEDQKKIQSEDLRLWFSLTVRSAHQRAWSMMAEYDKAPANWAGF